MISDRFERAKNLVRQEAPNHDTLSSLGRSPGIAEAFGVNSPEALLRDHWTSVHMFWISVRYPEGKNAPIDCQTLFRVGADYLQRSHVGPTVSNLLDSHLFYRRFQLNAIGARTHDQFRRPDFWTLVAHTLQQSTDERALVDWLAEAMHPLQTYDFANGFAEALPFAHRLQACWPENPEYFSILCDYLHTVAEDRANNRVVDLSAHYLYSDLANLLKGNFVSNLENIEKILQIRQPTPVVVLSTDFGN